jgi:hypothetical protein
MLAICVATAAALPVSGGQAGTLRVFIQSMKFAACLAWLSLPFSDSSGILGASFLVSHSGMIL